MAPGRPTREKASGSTSMPGPSVPLSTLLAVLSSMRVSGDSIGGFAGLCSERGLRRLRLRLRHLNAPGLLLRRYRDTRSLLLRRDTRSLLLHTEGADRKQRPA